MSEYQYYELCAIDRPLTGRQMRKLRAVSTRAAISRTSFSNHYEYGDLKVNPRDLLVKYFDASLYFAHWMYLEVAFRFPKDVVDVKTLRRYADGHTFDVTFAGWPEMSSSPSRSKATDRPPARLRDSLRSHPPLRALSTSSGSIVTSWRWPPRGHRERSCHHRAETSIDG